MQFAHRRVLGRVRGPVLLTSLCLCLLFAGEAINVLFAENLFEITNLLQEVISKKWETGSASFCFSVFLVSF